MFLCAIFYTSSVSAAARQAKSVHFLLRRLVNVSTRRNRMCPLVRGRGFAKPSVVRHGDCTASATDPAETGQCDWGVPRRTRT